MTLCTVELRHDRALLMTDTLCVLDGRPVAFVTKYYPLSHMTAVFAGRGPTELVSGVATLLNSAFWPLGFDDAAEALPDLCLRVAASMARRDGVAPEGEVVLLGWSTAAGGFAGSYAWHGDDFAPHELPEGILGLPCHASQRPGHPDYRPLRGTLAVRADAIAMAELQKDTLELERDTPSVGGDVVMTELTRAGTTTRKVHRLADYGDLAQKMEKGHGRRLR